MPLLVQKVYMFSRLCCSKYSYIYNFYRSILNPLNYMKFELKRMFLPYLSHFLASFFSLSSLIYKGRSLIPCIPCRAFQLLASQQPRRLDESKCECMHFFFLLEVKEKIFLLSVLRKYTGRNYALGNSSYCPQIDPFISKQLNAIYLKFFLLLVFSNIILNMGKL